VTDWQMLDARFTGSSTELTVAGVAGGVGPKDSGSLWNDRRMSVDVRRLERTGSYIIGSLRISDRPPCVSRRTVDERECWHTPDQPYRPLYTV